MSAVDLSGGPVVNLATALHREALALELAPHGIQVNAIAPGWFITDMTAAVRTGEYKAMEDEILSRTPAGRWGDPDELVGTAIFLASPASDFGASSPTALGPNDVRLP